MWVGARRFPPPALFGMARERLQRADWVPPGTRTINMIRLGDALTLPDAGVGGAPVKALVVYNSNPAAVAPELGKVRSGLAREDLFTVVLEHFQTDTADYADWLLPATTQLEHWDVHSSYGHLYVTLNRPAIQPVGESLPNSEIFRRMAAGLGYTDPEFGDSDLELIEQALQTDAPQMEGVTLEHLLEKGWARLNVADPYAPLAAPGRLSTPSGKIQILAPELESLGLSAMPDYTPPTELEQTISKDGSAGSLMLLSPPEHRLMNSTFANVPSIRRATGDATLVINPADAHRRNVVAGERVRIWNSRGHFFATAVLSEDVRPGVVASFGVRWGRFSEGGHTVNDTTSQHETDMGGGAVFYDNAVEVEPAPASVPAWNGVGNG